MLSFLICLALLVASYFTYGRMVDNTFAPDDRETPAVAINDGVDYVVLPAWKLFLVQLLNIAGLGPIFGAMQGALWGPIVFLWITFGTIFAGAVHDYFSGMLSERNNGASISEVIGIYLGPVMKTIMRVFAVVLLIMVGTVFAVGPAGPIVKLLTEKGVSGPFAQTTVWLGIILLYYFIATFISIDKIIGKIYPVFGICLIVMAIGVAIGIPVNGYAIPEIFTHFGSMHPQGTPVWSFMFITVACGAISGFHSTQSPLMARCLKSERQGHFVFYGAMIAEGIVAMIWAAAAIAYFGGPDGLNAQMAAGRDSASLVNEICNTWLGKAGAVIAILGVVICPITSGDTAFRSLRLSIADFLKVDQKPIAKRLLVSLPVFVVAFFFCKVDFNTAWKFLGIANQVLATLVLWTGAAYLISKGKQHWICSIPAAFLTFICVDFLLVSPAPTGLALAPHIGAIVGMVVALPCFILCVVKGVRAGSCPKPGISSL